ncbi:hypothetical protein I7I50_00089 [Histoplasma capsulatum G186AR]|uniref:Uncharacterized protein n=1 Tax=Ajellomyces capsulatus TaxID=5037 RepID=A0A8H7YF74_AJECA|nr:hypothetical protein I7I52_07358 [Histoplasma capsulatum]QSS72289.1 hypothetical protein I7I50_00089 [Histoplasma capsulatum G186AR]
MERDFPWIAFHSLTSVWPTQEKFPANFFRYPVGDSLVFEPSMIMIFMRLRPGFKSEECIKVRGLSRNIGFVPLPLKLQCRFSMLCRLGLRLNARTASAFIKWLPDFAPGFKNSKRKEMK